MKITNKTLNSSYKSLTEIEDTLNGPYISELIDNEQVNIGYINKTKLYIHLLMCDSCKNYKMQLTELHKAFQTDEINHFLPNLNLSKESEDRIQKLILDKLKEI